VAAKLGCVEAWPVWAVKVTAPAHSKERRLGAGRHWRHRVDRALIGAAHLRAGRDAAFPAQLRTERAVMAANTSVVLRDPQETLIRGEAVAGFLPGYSGRTRDAYTLDLGMRSRWRRP
jgi:hypothetical protein